VHAPVDCFVAPSVPIPKFANFAARSNANFGIEGRWKIYGSSAALNPKFATNLAALLGELRVRGTSAAPRNDEKRVGAAATRPSPTYKHSPV